VLRAVGRSEGVVAGGGATEGRAQVVVVCVAVVYVGWGVPVVWYVDDGAGWGELSGLFATFNGWSFGGVVVTVEG
jgi:hypothetical protein